MRILVYGAGVLGCELAHVLMQNKKNVVTLLARGEWKEMIDQKGLVIRHWVRRKTTTERIKTVDTLAPDDYYDLVFVVVQAGQLPDVLPVLKANKSQYFVFVGNNPQACGQCVRQCWHDGGRCHNSAFWHLPNPAQDRL